MTSNDRSVVTLDGVRFRWPGQASDIVAIDELTLNAGDHLFVRGASGSGKTTLLSLLTGINTPTSGEIRLLGTDLGSLSSSGRDRFRADHMGVVFQQFNLLPYLTALENVTLSCAFSPRKAERAAASGGAESAARSLLRALNLSDNLHSSPVVELSVGQQQRAAVARALIGSPEILLADEPTSALDADNRDRFLDLLFHEAEAHSCTLIFVSHDQQLANRFPHSIELDPSQPIPGGER